MEERALAVHYYEVLSGVYNDKKSKLIRYLFFVALFIGIIWAALSCYEAVRYSKVDRPSADSRPQPKVNNTAIQKLTELVRTVEGVRQAGSVMASTIDSIHSMPFKIDANNELFPSTLDTLTPFSTINSQPDDTPAVSVPVVKMIMTDENGKKLAVVDVGEKKALILRRGDKLPDGSFVLSIKSDGTLATTSRKKK